MNSSLVRAQIAGGGYLLLDRRHIGRGLGLDQQVGDGETGVGYVLQRAVVGRVEGRYAEQPARGDMRDADDDAAMIVELKLGANFRVFELVELRILDRDEGILGKDVLRYCPHPGSACRTDWCHPSR